jgi:hypothetical protein
LWCYCERNLLRVGCFTFFDRQVTLYERPALALDCAPGGWVTSNGLRLSGFGKTLAAFPIIELRGDARSFTQYLGKVPGVSAQLAVPDKDLTVALPASLEVVGDEYRIVVDARSEILQGVRSATVHLTFDSFFVPAELGIAPDPHQLVLRSPAAVQLRRSH